MKPTKRIQNAKTTTPRTRTTRRRRSRPTLRFSPYAWAKLIFLRDAGESEVGGFGITRPEDLLFVEDFVLVKQLCSPVTVRFDDAAVADYFDAQVDAGGRPEQFARIWIHTHPGASAMPSFVDEATFRRVFGPSDWAVMVILARGGQTYARLRFNTGPGGALVIPVEVDYRRSFAGSDHPAWANEYAAQVSVESGFRPGELDALCEADDRRLLPDFDHDVETGQAFTSAARTSAGPADFDWADSRPKAVPGS